MVPSVRATTGPVPCPTISTLRPHHANPRAQNLHGHIIEVIPPPAGTGKMDHTATEARWEIFIGRGKPGIDPGAQYHRATSENGWLSSPDNCAFDSKGRIW